MRTHIRKNHSNVVDSDTVELNSINNDGQSDIKPRYRRHDTHEATINPETGEMEGGPPASDISMRAIKHEVGAVRFDPSSQIPQWHIKVERPDLASQMMGLQRAVSGWR